MVFSPSMILKKRCKVVSYSVLMNHHEDSHHPERSHTYSWNMDEISLPSLSPVSKSLRKGSRRTVTSNKSTEIFHFSCTQCFNCCWLGSPSHFVCHRLCLSYSTCNSSQMFKMEMTKKRLSRSSKTMSVFPNMLLVN